MLRTWIAPDLRLPFLAVLLLIVCSLLVAILGVAVTSQGQLYVPRGLLAIRAGLTLASIGVAVLCGLAWFDIARELAQYIRRRRV